MIRQDWSTLKKLMFMKTAAGGGAAVEATATGNPLTFQTDLAKPLKSLLIPFTPKQEGTGDPSPENIRPIVPWEGLTVWQSGINLWDEEWEIGGLNGTTGQNTQSDNQIRSKNYNPCSPNTQYYVKHTLGGSDMRLCWYKKDKTFISSSWKGVGATTSPADAYYFRFCMASSYGTTYNNNISINYPSTKTGYNPHTENTKTDISFPSPVYEGTLDAVTGVLTVEWAEIASYNGETLPGEWMSDRDVYSAGTTPSTGAQVVYKLATPQEIQLTPAQITALVGNNTIWSDADGSMIATYLKKG